MSDFVREGYAPCGKGFAERGQHNLINAVKQHAGRCVSCFNTMFNDFWED